MSRRKLGSSRRTKDKHLAKDPETEPHYETKEDFEETSTVRKAFERHADAASQLEIQDKLTQDSEHGMSKMQDSTMSDFSLDYSATRTVNPGHLKSLIPGTGSLETCQVGNKLQEMGEPKHPKSDEAKKNVLLDDLFEAPGAFVSSDIFEPEAKITTEKTNPSEYTEGVDPERDLHFSAKETLPRNTEHDFHQLVDDKNAVGVDNISPSNLKEADLHAADQKNEFDHAHDLEQTGSSLETGKTDTGQMYEGGAHVEDHAKQSVGQTVYHQHLFETHRSNVPINSQPCVTDPFLTSEDKARSLSLDEQTYSSFGQTGSRKKFGSRRTIKGQVLLKETEEEVLESSENDPVLDKEKAFEAIQKEFNRDEDQDFVLSESQGSSMSLNASNPFTDVQSFSPTQMQEILQTNEAVTHNAAANLFDRRNNQHELTNQLSPTVESTDEPVTKQEVSTHFVEKNKFPTTDSEADHQLEGWVLLEGETAARNSQLSEFNVPPDPQIPHSKVVEEVKDDTVDPVKIQAVSQSGNSESFPKEAFSRSELSTEIFSDLAETPNAPQFTVENTDDSTTIEATPHVEFKPDEDSTKQYISDGMDLGIEDFKLYDMKNTEMTNFQSFARSQDREVSGPAESSAELNTDRTFDVKEGSHRETEEMEPLHSQSHSSSVSVDKRATDFHSRRKLGSSRKNKGKHNIEQFASEEYQETTDQKFVQEVIGQEKNVEMIQEQEEKPEAPQTKEAQFEAQVCTSESPPLSVDSAVSEETFEPQRQDECRKEKESSKDESPISEEQSAETQSVSQTDHTNDTKTFDVFEQIEIPNIKDSVFSAESGNNPKPQMCDDKRLENELDTIPAHTKINLSDEKLGQKVSEGLRSETEDTRSAFQSLQHQTRDVWDSQKNNTSLNPGGNSGTVCRSGEKLAEFQLERKDELDTFHSNIAVAHNKQNAQFGSHEFTSINPSEKLQLIMSDSGKFAVDKYLSFSAETENKEPHKDTEKLESRANLQTSNSSSENKFFISHENSTGKQTQKTPTESHCSSEQEIVFSEEKIPTNGKQNDHLKSASTFEALNPEDVQTSKPELEIPAEIQATQINSTIMTEEESTRLSLCSDRDLTPMDLGPKESCQILKGKSNSGERRKLGSSRKIKTKPQAKAFKASQESEEEEIEKEKILFNTMNEEELEDPISNNKVNTNNAETLDVSPDSDNEDTLKFTKDFDERHTKLVTEQARLNQLSGCETFNLTQSPQLNVGEDKSDAHSVLYPDEIIHSGSSTVHALDLELASESQNTHNLLCDKDSQGQEISLRQTSDARCVTMEASTIEVENSMDVQVKEEKNVPTTLEKQASQYPNLNVSSPLQGKTPSVDGKNMEIKSKEKRRKMGSTRKTQLNKKREEDTDSKENTKEAEVETVDLDDLKVREELLPTTQFQGTSEQEETKEIKSLQNEEYNLQNSALDEQGNENKVTTAFLQQSSSSNPFLMAAEVQRKINVGELSQVDDFTNTEIQSASAAAGINITHLQHAATNTWISVQTQMEPLMAEQVQVANEQQQSGLIEESHSKNLATKSSSPDLNSPRRRKLGSTRKNLHPHVKEDGSNQKPELEENPMKAITTWENIMKDSSSTVQEKDIKHKSESEQRTEAVFEAKNTGHVAESSAKSEQTEEESLASQSFAPETENDLNFETESTSSTKNDTQSESGGKRRKLGSNRKSRLNQSNKDQTAREVRMMDDLKEKEVTHEEAPEEHSIESPSLVKRSEEDEHVKKAVSFNMPSEKIPIQSKIQFGQDTRRNLSLAEPGNPDLKTSCFNVVIIGDSSVGKTSFMKRAQSGKFSLDLPASVGLDSFTWTVVVEGKSVVLNLWDTAGQERFRSITRQIFHKAQAFLLMYDISSTQSFSAVSYWANSIQESAAENVTVLLLGNKSDHERQQVKTEQGDILAKEYNYEFLECSAATGENVVQALEIVARMLSQRVDLREEATALHKEPEQKKRSTCC